MSTKRLWTISALIFGVACGLLGFTQLLFAGRGTVSVSNVVNNGGSPPTYTLTISASAGMTVNDHFGGKLAGGEGGVWLITAIGDATHITVEDSLQEDEGAPYGAPATGSNYWYSTPTTTSLLSKPPYTGVGWDAQFRRNMEQLDGAYTAGGTDIPVTDGGTGLSTVAADNLLLGAGASPLVALPPGAADTILSVTGTTPTYKTQTALLDTLGSTQGQILLRGAGTWAGLTAGAGDTVLSIPNGGGDPAYRTVTSLVDSLGSTQGQLLLRGAGAWAGLTAGASDTLLAIPNGGGDPLYRTATSILDSAFGNSAGQVLFRGAANWEALTLGGQGTVLTAGVSSPAWATPASNFSDAPFQLYDDGDPTKLVKFQLSGLTTSTTRTYTCPDENGTLVTSATALAGDVTGTSGATVVEKLQTRAVASTAPTTGQVLTWTGSQWEPSASAGSTSGGVRSSLLATVDSVSLTATGTTNLYTATEDVVITNVVVRVTAATAANGDAECGVGVAAGEDDVYSSRAFTGLDAVQEAYLFGNPGVEKHLVNGDVVKLGVDVADTGTTLTVSVDIHGYNLNSNFDPLQVATHTRPPTTGWSWVNQGSVTEEGHNEAGVRLIHPDENPAGLELRMRSRTVSAGTTVTAGFRYWSRRSAAASTFNAVIFAWSDGTKFTGFYMVGDNTNVFVQSKKWSDFNTTDSTYTTLSAHEFELVSDFVGTQFWVKLEDDGTTNRTVSYSVDNVNYTTINTVSRTDFLTPSSVAWGLAVDNIGRSQYLQLTSWKEE